MSTERARRRPIGSRAVYEQSTGEFRIFASPDDNPGTERVVYECVGYSGRGPHRNDPDGQCVPRQGPLPRGRYTVGAPYRHPRLGPLAFRLLPHVSNHMCGRSALFIHGDNAASDASMGCIILDRPEREAVEYYRVRSLDVVRGA